MVSKLFESQWKATKEALRNYDLSLQRRLPHLEDPAAWPHKVLCNYWHLPESENVHEWLREHVGEQHVEWSSHLEVAFCMTPNDTKMAVHFKDEMPAMKFKVFWG